MLSQQPILKALFPDLPRDNTISDKSGEMMQAWQLFMQQNQAALQNNFKSEGILFPPLTEDQINTIESLYAPYLTMPYQTMLQNLPDISGQAVFDTTNRVSKQFIITFSGMPSIVNTAQWRTFAFV